MTTIPARQLSETRQVHASDRIAILNVTHEFSAAIAAKDGEALRRLLVHDKILFATPPLPGQHAQAFDWAGADSFIDFVATSPDAIAENFHNVQIIQDGHVAWVLFDFEFLEAGVVRNRGVECWQMLRNHDGHWKILSGLWSSNRTTQA